MSKLRFRYETIDFGNEVSIHVRSLHDTLQYPGDESEMSVGVDSSNWAIFGVIWDASRTLATMMFEHEIEGLRILEVGCGLALASLVLNERLADVTATDYNPAAQSFLAASTALNDGPDIPFVQTSWAEDIGELGKFDLIVGADVLYEPGHIESLATFIDNHAESTSEVIIIDPNRGNRARFSKKMSTFGYGETRTCSTPELGNRTDVLTFNRYNQPA